MATTVKNAPKAGAKKARVSAGWIDIGDSPESSINILEEYSVAEFKESGYALAAQVKLNSNGTKYLLCLDEEEGKKAALYMFKAFAGNVVDGQIMKPDEVSIFLIESEQEGKMVESFIIGTPGYKGGIVFF